MTRAYKLAFVVYTGMLELSTWTIHVRANLVVYSEQLIITYLKLFNTE